MTQQQGSRDEDAPGGVTGTGDGTGGSLGTSSGDTGAAGKSGGGTTGGVSATGDGTDGSLGRATDRTGKDRAGGPGPGRLGQDGRGHVGGRQASRGALEALGHGTEADPARPLA